MVWHVFADHQVFNDYVSEINDELSYVQLELRKCLNQYDGKAYYGVVNTVSDEHSKLGTKYSVPQIALYKGIVSFMFKIVSLLVIVGLASLA